MDRPAAELIVGDITAVDDATVSTRSGSLTATLRRSVRTGLDDATRLVSAAFQFDDGTHAVLLAGPGELAGDATVRIRRAGHNRFILELDAGDAVELDDLTAAFVALKAAQLRHGIADLPAPMDADDWDAHVAGLHRRAERAAGEEAAPDAVAAGDRG